jgi:hypothetical protein
VNQKKIVGAFIIFLLLFIGAWKLEQAHKRVFISSVGIEPQVTETIQINSLMVPINEQQFEAFKSREYVRILSVFNENK